MLVYTFVHFCVDFSCFYWLFLNYDKGLYSAETMTLYILVYNIVAFGLQPFIGYIHDDHAKFPIAVLGCLFLLAGLFTTQLSYLTVTIIALGNAFFHVGGGSEILKLSGGRATENGIFVSSGALGVGLGTLAGQNDYSLILPVTLMTLSLLSLLLIVKTDRIPIVKPSTGFINKKSKYEVIILLAAVSIMIRSFGGSLLPLTWRTSPLLFLFPAVGACTGKALGGIIADRWGARNTVVSSLLAAALILTWGHNYPWLFLLGIILFNFSMSITLCAIYEVLPANPGLTFGITTLALLAGNIPLFFVQVKNGPTVFFILTVISAVCLFYILKKGGKRKNV